HNLSCICLDHTRILYSFPTRRSSDLAAKVGNRWRVCGLAATYTMLHAMGPARGRLLKYDQAVDDRRTCCVSFASLAFEAPPRDRSEEHTSELQSRSDLVCRLLLDKKK